MALLDQEPGMPEVSASPGQVWAVRARTCSEEHARSSSPVDLQSRVDLESECME